jgi:ATP-dependent Lon protease
MSRDHVALPLLPLRNAVLFPGVTMPFDVGRPKTIALAEALSKGERPLVAVFAQRDARVEDPGAPELHEIGVVARVVACVRQEGGTYALVVEGLERARLESVTQTSPYLEASVRTLADEDAVAEPADDELDALALTLRAQTLAVLGMIPQVPGEVRTRLGELVTEPHALADFVAAYVPTTVEDKVAILGNTDTKARVRQVLELVLRRLETLKMRERINTQVKDEMGKTQREHVLRQQLKAIQEELGGGEGDEESDLDQLADRVAKATLSEEALVVAKKQMKRLRSMQAGSPDYSNTRTYVEWILDLPWTATANASTSAAATVDIAAVRAVLDADHYGLEKVKKRILEFLAVRKLKSDKKGPILCLIGPPGVGKTSLGKSIAGALGKKLRRISLGGVHDEAAIRGHRRTYIGALPGQIIQGMKKVGAIDPVFMLDEVDKLGSDYRGDPSSALLEVLDPEQNDTFTDHYLEIPYDLSNVMFIATANVGDTIPAPLRDRMEIIEIPGYTRREKLAIARRHLVPKQLEQHGVTSEQLEITDEALAIVIDRYSREAGVRSLERQIAAVVRGVVVELAETVATLDVKRVVATEDEVRKYLGGARFTSDVAERTEDPGVATGLAWTPVGGEILFIEATRMPGKGRLTLTGQLGDVMKESAQAALSYVRSHADRFGIDAGFAETSDLHIHVPSGAMPKDGPSAGVTMLTAIVSLLTGIRVRHDVAMTGEITLRGRVLPIGGLKEKVLAAHRAGIKRIVAPERNRADLDDIPDEVKRELDFVFVGRMDQVIDAALERAPTPRLEIQVGDVASAAGANDASGATRPAAA